jgi:hypothetical protein
MEQEFLHGQIGVLSRRLNDATARADAAELELSQERFMRQAAEAEAARQTQRLEEWQRRAVEAKAEVAWLREELAAWKKVWLQDFNAAGQGA